MTTKESATLSLQVQDWAADDARRDLAFCADAPWTSLGLNKLQREQIEAALIHYARTAAARTLSALKLHGHIA